MNFLHHKPLLVSARHFQSITLFQSCVGSCSEPPCMGRGFLCASRCKPPLLLFCCAFFKELFFFSLIFRAVGLFVLWSSVLECIKVFKQGQGQGMGTQGFASTPALLCSLQSREESGGLANTCRAIRQPLVILTSKTWQRRAGREAEKGPGRPSECLSRAAEHHSVAPPGAEVIQDVKETFLTGGGVQLHAWLRSKGNKITNSLRAAAAPSPGARRWRCFGGPGQTPDFGRPRRSPEGSMGLDPWALWGHLLGGGCCRVQRAEERHQEGTGTGSREVVLHLQ